jgi:hypothetical protein
MSPSHSADLAGENAVLALSPFKYSEATGYLVRGQVFHLEGAANDHLLVGMDYVRAVPASTPVVQCSECGAMFVDDAARERHGKHFHDKWCDCGWKPEAGEIDKDNAMSKHMLACPVWAGERAEAAQRHLKVALTTS